MIDDLAYSVRKLVRTVMSMPANSVQPAEQDVAAGGQVDEKATVEIISDEALGTGARSYDTVGTVPDDVTTERLEQEHRFVASVNFYRRPPTSAYLRGFTVSADPDDYTAIDDGGFDITIDGTLRQVELLDFSSETTMTGIAAIIQTRLQAELAATTCAWDATNARFVVTSPTTTQASAVSGAGPSTIDNDPDPDPTDVSAVLGLTVAGGALPVNNRGGIARYSNAAFDRAARLVQKLRLSSSMTLMRALGLGFVSASPIRNLNAIVDHTWESRGQVDLTFNVVNREAEAIETILTAPLTTKFQGSGGVTTHDTEVTTP